MSGIEQRGATIAATDTRGLIAAATRTTGVGPRRPVLWPGSTGRIKQSLATQVPCRGALNIVGLATWPAQAS
jgi:hypothetical protein